MPNVGIDLQRLEHRQRRRNRSGLQIIDGNTPAVKVGMASAWGMFRQVERFQIGTAPNVGIDLQHLEHRQRHGFG